MSSAEVRPRLVGSFCPRWAPLRWLISRRRPEFRRGTVSDSLFRGQPVGGVGLDVLNSGEPFPPLVGVLLSHFHSGSSSYFAVELVLAGIMRGGLQEIRGY